MRWYFKILLFLILLTGCSLENKATAPFTKALQPPNLVEVTNTKNFGTLPPLNSSIVEKFTSTVQSPSQNPSRTITREPLLDLTTTPPVLTIPKSVTPTIADDWETLPVIPEIDNRVIQIYQSGLEMGNNPHAFSKIGDCGSTPAWFLGDFDLGAKYYRLGDFGYLEEVIDIFQGSYGRTSLAAKSGFNASSLFATLWSDREQCESNEIPLACEFRVHQPSIVFIMLGTNDVWHPEEFEPQMRKIIEFSIEHGVIPILSTKVDNQEKDHRINRTITQLATEYQIPLWNFWLSVQTLPDQGLQEDKAHLTWGKNYFDDEEEMTKAWPWRNLTALQMLDAIWKVIKSQSN